MQLHRVNYDSIIRYRYSNRRRKGKYTPIFSDYSVPAIISSGVFIPNNQASTEVQSVARILPPSNWIEYDEWYVTISTVK